MNPADSSNAAITTSRTSVGRSRRVREALDEFIRRRGTGESIDTAKFLAGHSDLMPVLAEELELLRLMDNAVSRSRNGDENEDQRYRRTFALPEQVGGYRIERELHRGAQGVVYQAVQESTGRTVAVKVLHPGAFGRPADSARFVREVEILAHLRHPHIVSILDSGVADGCHFFAMDYVEGLALDEELAARPRPIRATLALFLQIADAIVAAHLRGVIHRDLKPGNIRVDEAGRAHVLDFGLAKLASEQSQASMTADGQFLGSLPWASPEQIGGAGDVDVRSDVYSLGVILFQMLTNQFPYRVVGPIQEVITTITTVEPQPPSRVVGAVGSELDTIVLKCLSKSPVRRYQSAAELAADVRRYLADEPIDARRDSTLYVVGKHIRRHRWPVALAGLALSALLAFTFYSAAQARANQRLADREQIARIAAEEAAERANAAQREADRERDAANLARDNEAVQRRAADFAAGRANAVTAFFVRTFGVADPDASQTGSVTLHSLLDRAAEEVEPAFENDPASEASVRSVLGRAYATFGRVTQARTQLVRAVELHESARVGSQAEKYETLWAYTHVLDESGTREEWRTRWRQLWRSYPGLLEPVSSRLAALMRDIAPERFDGTEPERLDAQFERLLTLVSESIPAESPARLLLADYVHLAAARIEARSRTQIGGRLLREALELRRKSLAPTNLRMVRIVDALISNYLETHRFDEAEALARESVETLRARLAQDHWFVALHQSQVGVCLARQGQFDAAEDLIARALPTVERALGAESANAIEVAARLADLYQAAGRTDQADDWRESIAARMAASPDIDVTFRLPWALGSRHAPLAAALQRLSDANASREREIEPAVREIIALRAELVSPREPRAALIAEFLWFHAKAYANRVGFTDETLALLRDAHELASSTEIMRVEKRGTVAWWLGYQHERAGRLAETELLARTALECFEQQRPRNERLIGLGRSLLGGCLSGMARHDEAEPLVIDGLWTTLRLRGSWNGDTEVCLSRLLRHFQACDRLADAAPHIRATMNVHNGNVDQMILMVGVRCPVLAERLRALRSLKNPDRGVLRSAIVGLIATRRAELEPADAFAAFYSDALYGILDTSAHGARTNDCDLWRPAAEEIVAIHTLQYGPKHRKTTFAQWWHAATLLNSGEFAACEALSQEVHELRLNALATDFPGGYTRFEPLLARARMEQGRLAEPEAVMPIVHQRAVQEHGPDSFHSTEAFGHVMRMFVARGRADQAADFAKPILSRALETSTNARALLALSWRVVQHSGLPGETYGLAAAVARRALEQRRVNREAEDILSLALLRSGDETEALRAIDWATSDDRPSVVRAFVRATARRQRGEPDPFPDGTGVLGEIIRRDENRTNEALRSFAHEFDASVPPTPAARIPDLRKSNTD